MALENLDDDAVVISGMSGRFPKSGNINDLMVNLMKGIDCVSADHTRWSIENIKIPSRIGTMKEITKLDNVFFGINAKLVNYMDPTVRLTTEVTFEAVIDAGINPIELRNTKTAVFGALTLNESDKALFYEKLEQSGLNLLGCCRAMISNRMSFCLGLVGPSCTMDTACTSSALAITKAYEAIKSGICDEAIVDSGVVILHPQTSYHMYELGLLSPDGVNRSFDAKASGFTRSESIGVLFLQKAKNAKRIYAEVVNSTIMFGKANIRNSCFFASAEFQAQMMKQTLKQCDLKPSDITYIEADGTAIKEVDREELKAIDLVYAQDRSPSNPLLIGSIKSNIGHALCNNAINSIIKVIIAMETGVIPPNLHYDEPPEDAKCLRDGRVKVVTKPTPWKDDYAAVNTCSFAGTFSHIILKRYSKEKKKRELSSNAMPRLYVVSARTEEMISTIFNTLQENKADSDLAQLIYDITINPFPYSLYAGYIIIPEVEAGDTVSSIDLIPDNLIAHSQQIWFIFSGMGSQWTGMGESLMKIPIFAEAIRKCDAVLKPRGYDIVQILCDKDPTIYDNIINSFLGIAAVQIGLVDILNAVGIKPHYMIGHSVGELGCAYADGCFTAEEMILSALSRGLASIESNLIHGTMAAVGLGYEQIRHLCPEDIDVACHNSFDSSTISGPTESIKVFVKELQEKGIFAKIVPTSNIAYHSRYIAPAGQKLLKYLQKVISHPKARSKRWICTSIPKNEWHLVKARLSSAEYHTNNLLSPVLFEEILTFIPKNAITIEIAPHGLLQAILKKSMHSDCINLALTRRDNKDNTTLLLSTLGKLHNLGCPIKPGNLYPRVPYPVSKGTPSISSLVRWEHSLNWYVNFFKRQVEQIKAERSFMLDLKSDKYKFLQDFKIGNIVIIPLTFCLKLVLDIYSDIIGDKDIKSFTFENIYIYDVLLRVPSDDDLTLLIMVFQGSGNFEIKTKDESMIASGTIRSTQLTDIKIPDLSSSKEKCEIITKEDFYADLLIRGYEYGEYYNLIDGLSLSCSNGTLTYKNDWALLLEGLFQVHIFSKNSRKILMPSMIQKIVIDMRQFTEEIKKMNTLSMKFDKRINVITCPGILMSGVKFEEVTPTDASLQILTNEIRFIPNLDETEINIIDVCHVVLGILSENISENTTGTIMVIQESKDEQDNILECIENILKETNNSFEIQYVAKKNIKQMSNETFNLMIIDYAHFNDLRNTINIGTESFLLTIIKTEDQDKMIATFTSIGLNLVLKKKIALDRTVLLLRKVENAKKPIVIKNQDNCIDHLKKSLRDSKYDRVIFLVNTITENNIFETLRILKQEPGYKKLQVLDLQNSNAPKFSLKDIFYQNQIKLNLYQNVLSSDNVWGTYRWMPLSERSTSLPRWRANIEKSGSLTLMEELSLKEKDKSIVKVECAAFDLNIYEYWLDNEVNLDSQICITEYSGTDEKGHRVMGLLQNLTISNEICPDPDFTWTIPDSLSFEDAATMPQAYLAAFSILHKNSYYFTKIKTILIHIGASELGQALINLSLWYNFDVYTTYETETEKRVIQSIQPRLPDSHIMYIKDYKAHVYDIMKGKRMDFIVARYSILDELESSIDILETHKNLILVFDSKTIDYRYNQLERCFGMSTFLEGINIYSHCLQDLMYLTTEMKRKLKDLMRTALQAGTLKPLISRKVYLPKKTQERRIEVCERYGKVLVNLQELEKCSYFVPRLSFRNDKCYFIVGDFNIFGIAVIEWMIEQGVRKLLIASNKSIKDRKDRVLKWCENGATVIIREKVDMSKATNVDNLLKEVASLGQLEAIFDLQRTSMDSSASLPECSKITKILDEESRKLCPSNVKFFVFSSPNSNDDSSRDPIVEKICKQRMKSGLHGLFILLIYSIENKHSTSQFMNTFYTNISLFLQRLSTFLNANASLIALRFIKTKQSINDNEMNIISVEAEKKEFIEMDQQEEEVDRKMFEKYLYRRNYVTL
ncbi:fatty acid synthase-like [Vespa mandarinia]|uniref:fatty acid synthase-like n=1 Tax=Vespa mandarinia TaxID=7446 RepID=UPI00161045A0|nr:fatty acid synthase-like [Vespa mandarinia]